MHPTLQPGLPLVTDSAIQHYTSHSYVLLCNAADELLRGALGVPGPAALRLQARAGLALSW